MSELNAWVESGKHLPPWLQDFHDQKDLFKAIQVWTNPLDREKEPDPHYSVTWVQGHCYTIDTFLRFMAFHGFTLQRTRKRLEFCDLDESIGAVKEQAVNDLRAFLERNQAEKEVTQ
jgi:hypothetical protein